MMKYLSISALFFFITLFSYGQGCSDPGICTIGTLNSETTKDSLYNINYLDADLEDLLKVNFNREKVRIEGAFVQAAGETFVPMSSFQTTLAIRIKKKMLLSVKIPYNTIYGKLGSNNGLGDITISFQNTFYANKNKRFSYTLGFVIPGNSANAQDNGYTLPMVYQTSLGLYSGLFGVSGAIGKWGFATGYQHSFGRNDNTYNTGNLLADTTFAKMDPLNADRLNHAESNSLWRGGDIFLRIERRFDLNKKWSVIAGLLPIYRLQKSTVEGIDGERYSVEKSNGLTPNMIAGLRYSPNKNWLFRFNAGRPIYKREVAPDGLKREYIGILSVAYKFW